MLMGTRLIMIVAAFKLLNMRVVFIILFLFTKFCAAQDSEIISKRILNDNRASYVISTNAYSEISINGKVSINELFYLEEPVKRLGIPDSTRLDTSLIEITRTVLINGIKLLYTNYPGDLSLTNVYLTQEEHFIQISGKKVYPNMSLSEFKKLLPDGDLIMRGNAVFISQEGTDGNWIKFHINESQHIEMIEIIRSFA